MCMHCIGNLVVITIEWIERGELHVPFARQGVHTLYTVSGTPSTDFGASFGPPARKCKRAIGCKRMLHATKQSTWNALGVRKIRQLSDRS